MMGVKNLVSLFKSLLRCRFNDPKIIQHLGDIAEKKFIKPEYIDKDEAFVSYMLYVTAKLDQPEVTLQIKQKLQSFDAFKNL